MSVYRLSSILVAIVCAVFLVFVLPGQVEVNTMSRVAPIDLPWFSLALMAVTAVFFIFEADMPASKEPAFMVRLVAIIALTIGAVFTLGTVRFEFLMPIYALTVMLLIGERRWYWLAAGVIVPVIIWVIVEIVLRRPLP